MYKDIYSSSPANKRENIRRFRKYLGMTQSEFIAQYLSNESGMPEMSTATLSNLEAKGGKRLNDVVNVIAEAFSMDPKIFMMVPSDFSEKLIALVPKKSELKLTENNISNNSAGSLMYRLTAYFAEQIFTGEMKRGGRIPSERKLAKIMGVGRFTIRETMRVLKILGVVDIIPGMGTFLSENNSDFLVLPIAWTIFLNDFRIENVLELREIMEVCSAGKAAIHMSKKEISRLNELEHGLYDSCQKSDFSAFSEYDVQFHRCLVMGSRNQILIKLQQITENIIDGIGCSELQDKTQMEDIIKEHNRIIHCIENGDYEGAGRSMKEHLKSAENRIPVQFVLK